MPPVPSRWFVPLAVAALTLGPAAPSALAQGADAPIRGSIRVPAEPPGRDETDQAEAARLAALAKITPAQAIAAARKRVGGQAQRAKLDEEDGYLVYEVKTSTGHEVLVDAGNGKVLRVERNGP